MPKKTLPFLALVALLSIPSWTVSEGIEPLQRGGFCDTICSLPYWICLDESRGTVCFEGPNTCGENSNRDDYDYFCRGIGPYIGSF